MKLEGSAQPARSVGVGLKAVDDNAGMDVESLIRSFNYHLGYTLAKDQYTATNQDRYQALALAVRDRLVGRWIQTQQAYHIQNVKRICYLSLEFLIGRAMGNNVINLLLEDTCREAMRQLGLDWDVLRDVESDAALGNGGLGRLAACFLDSMATLQLPALGYGIRYDYGIFKQHIENGYQLEDPDNWLRYGNPWEVVHPELSYIVNFEGRAEPRRVNGVTHWDWIGTRPIIGVAYDTPIVGYGTFNVNNLRLWAARATDEFHFGDFSRGSYVEAVEDKLMAENLTKVLYPSDAVYAGRELRLRQQYFFVSCSIQDIVRRFKVDNDDWMAFPDKVFVQMNDTHPALVVPELMRVFLDKEDIEWEKAWEITVNSTGYTNHTLLPEALERWPVSMFERLLPRHLQIIYEINSRFLRKVATRYPGDFDRLRRMSLVQEDPEKSVRMANLAVVGSCSTNGVAELHSRLLKDGLMRDFAEFYPERFNNKTNGVTPRRWLLKANPRLSSLIREKIGDGWINDLDQLRALEKFVGDAAFTKRIREIKHANKVALADYIKRELGLVVDPNSMFQAQVKRIHEYKRQLLLCLYTIVLYDRLKSKRVTDMVPVTFIFGGKAAPGYYMAKLIIKLIHQIGGVINHDPDVADRIKVVFLPDYRVSLAEKIMPAADLSVQISTAGMEASGTGNMKFQINGALTIGTLDGANVEIKEEVGDDNIFIFGLTTEQVDQQRGSYDPRSFYDSDEEIRRAVDLIGNDFFSLTEPGIFRPIIANLLEHGDFYMNLADLRSFIEAQGQVEALYRDQEQWSKKAIYNIARSGKFSSDRTIAEYAKEIWNVKAVDVVPAAAKARPS
ncbi:MAG: glycogen/starch/alpha-glucan phosphorylase [Rhodospirillales bacterium]|nr:glycogen/starch/alpha-glucan phosphorylase [Rhodospirillales bacterium]